MKTQLHFLFLILLFAGCSNERSDLIGHYYLASSRRASDLDHSKRNQAVGYYLEKESFMDFFKNGTYCLYLNQFEEGRYELEHDTIIFTPIKGPIWSITFEEDENLGYFKFPAAEKPITLRKISNDLDYGYPFVPDLNQWRQQGERRQSNNELIERFQNYLTFMQAYMRWAKNNEMSLHFNDLSGPLQFANNGLMMRKLKDSNSWCTYFFPGDCERLDRILRNYFDGLIIDWKYTHNRIAMLIDAMDQVSKGINNHKENFTQE
jgi:hypothetical protein